MKHKDHKGKLKTELAQVAPCSGCGKCIDFDQRQQGSLLCTCECSFEKHHTLSLMQHFQQGRPGFLILKTIALNIYPQLKRRGRKEGKEIKKKTLRTGNACIECGCGDYAAMYSGASICVCQHDTEEHSASYNDSPTRELDTYLSIIGDRIYMEQRHLRGPDWLKTSLFQIEDSGECQDFEFRRHRTFHTDNSAHDYCRCGGKRYSDHRRILATRLEFVWNMKEREGVKAAYETNW
ncbi:hypothetical protein B0O99DRAFT_642683 [Bisporella sp. PMI_857]|nr:hypothetical protein B0O99DRAFT_642683 [Bisporella sp. PMI_857]